MFQKGRHVLQRDGYVLQRGAGMGFKAVQRGAGNGFKGVDMCLKGVVMGFKGAGRHKLQSCTHVLQDHYYKAYK